MKFSWSDIADRLRGRDREEGAGKHELRSDPVASSQLIVGLDFGTSGTKVVVRDAMRRKVAPFAIDFGTPQELGFSRFAVPSTAAIHDGHLRFGSDAERCAAAASEVHRSLKRKVLGLSKAQKLPSDGDAPVLAESDTVHEFLVTMFLADVLRRTWTAIANEHADVSPDDVIVNLDVPVASLSKESQVAEDFLRMLRIARIFSTEDMEAVPARELGERWLEVRGSWIPPSPESERREDLVPEAIAAIGGLGETARRGSGDANYVVVDIGAGTTDLGVFRYPDREKRRAVFYAARTTPIGCDDVDREICRLLGRAEPNVHELGEVRLGKTRIGTNGLTVFGSTRLSSELIEEAVTSVEEDAREQWQRTFGDAYEKEKVEDRWRRLELFIIGGGSMLPALSRVYHEPPWDRVREVIPRTITRNLSLRSSGNGTDPPSPGDMVFLLTALGLSLPPPDRPEMQHPDEVQPLKPEPSGSTGVYDFDADERYSG